MFKSREEIAEEKRLKYQDDYLELPKRREMWKSVLTSQFTVENDTVLIPQIQMMTRNKGGYSLSEILVGRKDLFLAVNRMIKNMEENRASSLQSTECCHGMEGIMKIYYLFPPLLVIVCLLKNMII